MSVLELIKRRNQLIEEDVVNYFTNRGPIRQKTGLIQVTLSVTGHILSSGSTTLKLKTKVAFLGRGIPNITVRFTENDTEFASVKTDSAGEAFVDALVSIEGSYRYQSNIRGVAQSSIINVSVSRTNVASNIATSFTVDGKTFNTPIVFLLLVYPGRTSYSFTFPDFVNQGFNNAGLYTAVQTNGRVLTSRSFQISPPINSVSAVYVLPVLQLSASPASGTQNDTFRMTARATDKFTGRGVANLPITLWDVNLSRSVDTRNTDENGTVVFTFPPGSLQVGIYTMQVKWQDFASSSTVSITVSAPPVAPTQPQPPPPQPTQPITTNPPVIDTFTATGTDPYTGEFLYDPSQGKYEVFLRADWHGGDGPSWSIDWNFGDGQTIRGGVENQNAVAQYHYYPPGSWTATLKITDSKGASGIRSVSFSLPQPAVSESPPPTQGGDPYEYYATQFLRILSPNRSRIRRQVLATLRIKQERRSGRSNTQ